MKKIYGLFIIALLLICFTACQGQIETTVSDTVFHTTDPVVQRTPTYVYTYDAKEVGSIPLQIESPIVYYPDIDQPSRNLFFVDSDFEKAKGAVEADFVGTIENAGLVKTYAAFPMYPKEFGAFSVYSFYNSVYDRGTVHIRHDTNKPIYFHGRNETVFQELDMEDRDAVVAFATNMLKRYATFDGYTLFVYEDKVYTTHKGIIVEYNLTIGGEKTNCYVKMGIAYNHMDYVIELTNDIEPIIRPHVNATVDVKLLDAAIDEVAWWVYCEVSESKLYKMETYQADRTLMVLDGKIMAYVKINPQEFYLTPEGLAYYHPGSAKDEKVRVVGMETLLLVEIASIEYVTE